MANLYSGNFLRKLRNELIIDRIIRILRLETRSSNGIIRFQCPLCYKFHTATNPKTNLGRCFDCKKNYNPIDLVMAATQSSFIETIDFLKKHINGTTK